MYEWISQYLNNRKARAQVNGANSRQKTLREGVPQGGVLNLTLFLIYVNDIIAELPRKIHSALYADDMVLWCSAEYITTDNYRMQQALEVLESWTKKWSVKIKFHQDHIHRLQSLPKRTEGNSATWKPNSECRRQPHISWGNF